LHRTFGLPQNVSRFIFSCECVCECERVYVFVCVCGCIALIAHIHLSHEIKAIKNSEICWNLKRNFKGGPTMARLMILKVFWIRQNGNQIFFSFNHKFQKILFSIPSFEYKNNFVAKHYIFFFVENVSFHIDSK
jgi:hypothetical protein